MLKECQIGNKEACKKFEIACKKLAEATPALTEDVLFCKDSCPLDNKCYPFGYRKKGNYCSDSGAFVTQLETDKTCDNHFECASNLCTSGTCFSPTLLEQIIGWFKKIFTSA